MASAEGSEARRLKKTDEETEDGWGHFWNRIGRLQRQVDQR